MTTPGTDRFQGEHYTAFKNFLAEACGIVLGENKQYLVSSRLTKILDQHDIKNLSLLIDVINQKKVPNLKETIVDAMTTNETLWFRDGYPFSLLSQHIIPAIRQGKILSRPLKIWSAASSSGQEAYSISMTISEYLRVNPGSLSGGAQIIGTDISKTIIDLATKGEYDLMALSRGLSTERKKIFFEEISETKSRIKEDVRKRVLFKKLNLLENFSSMGKFDVIYCRNVLIYFSPEVKQDILNRMAKQLNSDGFFYVGGTESLGDAGKLFEMIRCNPGIIYKLK